jgi:hypothetical protein
LDLKIVARDARLPLWNVEVRGLSSADALALQSELRLDLKRVDALGSRTPEGVLIPGLGEKGFQFFRLSVFQLFTGGKGIRTPDLLIANETLYQLSYTPEIFEKPPLNVQNLCCVSTATL